MQNPDGTVAEQNRFIAQAVEREAPRLRRFIGSRVFDQGDVEDVLQDVFYELIAAYRLMKPAEQMTAWLFRVARNRITDLFRRRGTESLDASLTDEATGGTIADLLPSPEAGPDAVFAGRVLTKALEDALDELPAAQREVFLAHEFEGRSFKELSAETATPVNTLLSRKRYAVLHLRRRLLEIHEEYGNKRSSDETV